MNSGRVYVPDPPVIPNPPHFSLWEWADLTAQLCVVAAYVWVILKIAGAL